MKFFTMGCASSKEVSGAVSDASEEEKPNKESLVHQQPETTTEKRQQTSPPSSSSTDQPSLVSKKSTPTRPELKVTGASIGRMARIIEKEGSDFFEEDDMAELDNLLNQMDNRGRFTHSDGKEIPLRQETSMAGPTALTVKKSPSIPSSSSIGNHTEMERLPSTSTTRIVNGRGGKENQPVEECLPPGQLEFGDSPQESPKSTNGSTKLDESMDWKRVDSGQEASSPEHDPWHSIQKVYQIQRDASIPRNNETNSQINDMAVFDEEGKRIEPQIHRSSNKGKPSKPSRDAGKGVRKGQWGEGQMAQAGSLMMGQGCLESSSSSGTLIELDVPRFSDAYSNGPSESSAPQALPQKMGTTDDLALEEIEDLEAELEQSIGKLDDLEAKFLQFERDNPLDDDLDDLYKLEPPPRRH